MTIYQRVDARNKIVVLTDDGGDQLTVPLEHLIEYDGIKAEVRSDDASDLVWTEHRSIAEWLHECFVPKSTLRRMLDGDRRGRN